MISIYGVPSSKRFLIVWPRPTCTCILSSCYATLNLIIIIITIIDITTIFIILAEAKNVYIPLYIC